MYQFHQVHHNGLRGGGWIKRPAVWIFTALVILFAAYRFFFSEKDDARYYIMDAAFEDKAEADITGVVYNYEGNNNGCSVYLKDVSVHLKDNTTVYRLPRILVYVKEEPCFKTGSRLKVAGSIFKIEKPSNPGQFNQREYLKEKNIYYTAAARNVETAGNAGGIYYGFLRCIRNIKNKLAEVYGNALPGKQGGIVTAMLLGDKTLADIDIKNLYKQSGIGHLLAISGLHISILGMAVYKFIQSVFILLCNIAGYIYKDKKTSLKYIKTISLTASLARVAPVAVTLVFIFAYGSMTGFGISTCRAVIMMSVLLLAPLIYRSYDMLSALGASAVIILLQKPFAVFSCSFLLSFGAVLGITLVYPAFKKLYTGGGNADSGYNKRKNYIYRFKKFLKTKNTGRRMPVTKEKYLLMYSKYILYILFEKTADLFLTSLSIQIITIPVILYFYYEFPLYGVFINIIVIPLMPLIVVTAAAGGVMGVFFMPAAKFLLGSTCFLLDIYETICRYAAKLPLNIIIAGRPGNWQVVVYFIILAIIIYIVLYKDICHVGLTAAMLLAALCIILYTKRYNGVNITFLDTGQGDAIFIQDNNGTVYLVDGGSSNVDKTGLYRIIPFLKYNGIKEIGYMVMTHPDEDHISGLREIIGQPGSGIKVNNLLVPGPAPECKDEAYYGIVKLALQNNINTAYIKTGDTISDNKGFSIKCLHPQTGFNAESANAYSTVLSITYGSTSFLLTGDIEGNGEKALLEKLNTDKTLPESYNVLKVAHHGSKNSSSAEFLERVSPDISVISCSKNNTYGHPHKELADRLVDAGSSWVATKDAGAITVLSDGNKITLKTYNKH